MRHKSPRVKRFYALCGVFFVLTFAVLLVLTFTVDAGAKAAPTATPQNENHCMMLTDGICYIIFPAHCVPGTPVVYGPESMGVPVECE